MILDVEGTINTILTREYDEQIVHNYMLLHEL
jgi:hypothetical protein